jgi:hypothetical protein
MSTGDLPYAITYIAALYAVAYKLNVVGIFRVYLGDRPDHTGTVGVETL